MLLHPLFACDPNPKIRTHVHLTNTGHIAFSWLTWELFEPGIKIWDWGNIIKWYNCCELFMSINLYDSKLRKYLMRTKILRLKQKQVNQRTYSWSHFVGMKERISFLRSWRTNMFRCWKFPKTGCWKFPKTDNLRVGLIAKHTSPHLVSSII